MAEAVFADRASKKPHLARRIKVDSCGTAAYHVGEEPDERTVATCEKVCGVCSCLGVAVRGMAGLGLIGDCLGWVAWCAHRFTCEGAESGGFP